MHQNLLLYHQWERTNKYIFSSISELQIDEITSHEIGLKFVISGEENYKVGAKTYNVLPGRCLVLNPDQYYGVFNSKNVELSDGICVSLDHSLIYDIYRNCTLTDEKLADNPLDNSSRSFQFLEQIFPENDLLSKHFKFLSAHVQRSNGMIMLPQEQIFYGLAGHLLASQNKIRMQALRIRSLR